MKHLIGWATLAVAVATMGFTPYPALGQALEPSRDVTILINDPINTMFIAEGQDESIAGASGTKGQLKYGTYQWTTWYVGDEDVEETGQFTIDANTPEEIILLAPEAPAPPSAPPAGYDGNITVKVTDSAGEAFPGAKVYLGVGGWPLKGETDEAGLLTIPYPLPPNNPNMKVLVTVPNGGSKYTDSQDLNTNSTFEVQTDAVKFTLVDHSGGPLANGVVRIGVGGWPVIGTTDDDGVVEHEMFLGSIAKVRMSYNYGTEEKDVAACTEFQTGKVQMIYGGTIGIKVGGWPAFIKPGMELLPIPYTFRVNGIEFALTPEAGEEIVKSLVCLRVVKSNGTTGVPGATFKWAEWGGGSDQAVPGVTNDSGYLLHVLDGARTKKIRYIPTYNGVTGPRHDPLPATSSLELWKLVKVTVELRDHAGALIDTDLTVYYEYPGGGRKVFGDLVGGTATVEMMSAGSYCAFYIYEYNKTGQRKDAGSLAEGTKVVFQTGLLKFVYGGGVDFVPTANGMNGWHSFNKSGTEMLPANHRFKVTGSEFYVNVGAGADITKSLVNLRVVKSNGSTGAAGATFTWAEHSGGPSGVVPGATNSAGYLLHVMNGAWTKQIKYEPKYEGVPGPRKDPKPATSSLETWQLVKVTVALRNHLGALINAPVVVTYESSGSGAKPFGTLSGGSVTREMMSTGALVAFTIANYNDTKQRKDLIGLGNGSTVTFQTGLIKDNGWGAQYFRISGGANNTGISNPAGLEVLPGSNFYFFKSGAQIGPRTISAGQVNLINADGTIGH